MALNSLIINFSGLGDGLIEIPFLKNMERVTPHMNYYHAGGVMFSQRAFMKALDLRNCLGTVPSLWRKFYEDDWRDITTFIETKEINVIINLRNLGPSHDTGYFAFRQRSPKNVEYWNYTFDASGARPTNIRTNIHGLLLSKSLIDHSVNPLTLRKMLSPSFRKYGEQVGINIHSGSEFKLWPYEKWRSLCCELLKRDETLKIFPGFTEVENSRAKKLANDLENYRAGRTTLINKVDLMEMLHEVANTKILISTDSWLLHAAAGLGLPAIGLYVVTSPVTWGADSNYFQAVESKHLKRCEKFDRSLGICRNGYVECPLIGQEGDGIEVLDVAHAFDVSSVA